MLIYITFIAIILIIGCFFNLLQDVHVRAKPVVSIKEFCEKVDQFFYFLLSSLLSLPYRQSKIDYIFYDSLIKTFPQAISKYSSVKFKNQKNQKLNK